MKIIIAINNNVIDKFIFDIDGIEVLEIVSYRSELMQKVQSVFESNEIDEEVSILISGWLLGDEDLFGIMLNLKMAYGKKLRIIYLNGEVNKKDSVLMTKLNALISLGVYDIFTGAKINKNVLVDLIFDKRTIDDVRDLIQEKKESSIRLSIDDEMTIKDEETLGYNNMIVVSSIKPGTGKSFVSSNIAACVAAYGVMPNGKKPKVCIVEADLQTLSVGTLLGIQNDKYNLKTVMDKISTLYINHSLVDDPAKFAVVDDFIKKCFIQHPEHNNLFVLAGSQLSVDQIESIEREYYEYLIKTIVKEFDFVIVDTNSSLHHTTTYPLLKMASKLFYILNMDFNNVMNNVRYRDTLKEIEVLDKVQYVLNQDIPEEDKGKYLETVNFDVSSLRKVDIELVARIPDIDRSVFLNRLVSGVPIIFDETAATLKARLEISKIVNTFCKTSNLQDLENSYQYYLSTLQKKKFAKK